MSFALNTLWHERQRFIPGVLAVAFSALLIAIQCGLLMGLLAVTSIPVDNTHADIWATSPDTLSVDLGQPIPMSFVGRLAENPEVDPSTIEPFIELFGRWKNPAGGTELCIVLGCQLHDGASGAIRALTPELRELLTEPDSIVVDKGELGRLGLTHGIGETGEIYGRKVRVVGLVNGYRSLAGPYVFCSVNTARALMRNVLNSNQTIYLLAKCYDRSKAQTVVNRLKERYVDSVAKRDMSVFTAAEFSWRSRMHWLFKTKAGVAIGYTALLGLLVGAVVTSQTLYAATVASIRELAILRALGIPRWRMVTSVMTQSFWVGLVGVVLSIPTIYGMAKLATIVGAKVLLPASLLGVVSGITLTMAVFAGLFALRSLRQVEPANLLR
jgi:putative ABC transport system permease protein